MKKKHLRYSRIMCSILAIAGITTGLVTTTLGRTEKNKTEKPLYTSAATPKNTIPANYSEENALMAQLIKDGLINEFKGFVVEKRNHKLIINGHEQNAEIAEKYLPETTKEVMRIQVAPFTDRQQQYPDATLIQLLSPSTFSSPCVNYNPDAGC